MSRPDSEAQVVYWLKQGLVREGIGGRSVSHIHVDHDGAYTQSPFRKALQPFGSVRIAGRRPDLLCLQTPGKRGAVIAFEVKPSTTQGYEKGVMQAFWYRKGASASYLCVPHGGNGVPPRLEEGARQNGIGLVSVSSSALHLHVPPASPLPDGMLQAATYSYLQSAQQMEDLRKIQLNRPLHYIAAAVAVYHGGRVDEAQRLLGKPDEEGETWGLGAGAVRHALNGAVMLGLLDDQYRLTPRGLQYAQLFEHLGFNFRQHRPLTRRARLVDDAPTFAAVLRTLFLDHLPTALILQVLRDEATEGISIRRLAQQAQDVDSGTALAVFGDPNEVGWLPTNSVVFQLKRALHDIGILDSPLAPGASRIREGRYDPDEDVWILGRAMKTRTL